MRISRNRSSHPPHGLLCECCATGNFTDLTERFEPALAHDAAGRLADDAEHPAHAAALVAHRIVRDVEVGLLGETVPLKEEPIICTPESVTVIHHLHQEGAQHVVPKLAPYLPRRAA